MSNFNSSPSSEVTIKMELFLQLQSLVTGVSLSASFSFCKKTNQTLEKYNNEMDDGTSFFCSWLGDFSVHI